MELILNHYKSLQASCLRFSNTVFKFAPQEYKVLLSAKLQKSDFSMTKNKSFINILNNKGPVACCLQTIMKQQWNLFMAETIGNSR